MEANSSKSAAAAQRPRRAKRNANLISFMMVASVFLAIAAFAATKTHYLAWMFETP
ncbi:MAG TPA: hypothetical protein VET85_07640 [Stellaceae bacterium]|nr:hypothetical protein [Stellaceae bacterium]